MPSDLLKTIRNYILTAMLSGIPVLIGMYYKVNELQAQVIEIKDKNSKLEEAIIKIAERFDDMKDAMGRSQLDIALICAEIVKDRGGNPLVECKTMGGK